MGAEMLNEANVVATVAVKDINAGKKFYGETLGLKQADESPGGVTYQSGTGKIFVYPSQTAGTGQATCAFWDVVNIENVVKDLTSKGIKFEHYDMPEGARQGDIYLVGRMKAAWFKDPDGNVLGLGSNG